MKKYLLSLIAICVTFISMAQEETISTSEKIDATFRDYTGWFVDAIFYEIPFSDDGFKVSGGQRQRLSLARALLGNPEILLLDESTSNLDIRSEKNILKTIYSLIKREKLTVVFVTHRLSAIKNTNKLFDLKNGSISVS